MNAGIRGVKAAWWRYSAEAERIAGSMNNYLLIVLLPKTDFKITVFANPLLSKKPEELPAKYPCATVESKQINH